MGELHFSHTEIFYESKLDILTQSWRHFYSDKNTFPYSNEKVDTSLLL